MCLCTYLKTWIHYWLCALNSSTGWRQKCNQKLPLQWGLCSDSQEIWDWSRQQLAPELVTCLCSHSRLCRAHVHAGVNTDKAFYELYLSMSRTCSLRLNLFSSSWRSKFSQTAYFSTSSFSSWRFFFQSVFLSESLWQNWVWQNGNTRAWLKILTAVVWPHGGESPASSPISFFLPAGSVWSFPALCLNVISWFCVQMCCWAENRVTLTSLLNALWATPWPWRWNWPTWARTRWARWRWRWCHFRTTRTECRTTTWMKPSPSSAPIFSTSTRSVSASKIWSWLKIHVLTEDIAQRRLIDRVNIQSGHSKQCTVKKNMEIAQNKIWKQWAWKVNCNICRCNIVQHWHLLWKSFLCLWFL